MSADQQRAMDAFVANVTALASDRGWSERDLLERAGLSHGLLSDIRRGKTRSLTIETAEKVAETFGVPLASLLQIDNDVSSLAIWDRQYIEEVSRFVLKAYGVPDHEEVANALAYFAWNYRQPEMRSDAAYLQRLVEDAVRFSRETSSRGRQGEEGDDESMSIDQHSQAAGGKAKGRTTKD